MATDPQKLTIRDAIVTALQGVRIAQGYNTDIGQNVGVRRVTLANVSVSELPCVAVIYGDEDKRSVFEESPEDQQNLGASRDSIARFAVLVYVSAEDVDAELLRADADVKRALLSSPTLGGVCDLIRYVDASTDWQEFADTDRGEIGLLFAVHFNWSPDAA